MTFDLSRRSHEPELMDATNKLSSDEFFAQQIGESGNVILATEGDLLPQQLFSDPAADISSIAKAMPSAVAM